MNFDQEADQLHALPPPEFTAARNAAADRARDQGDAEPAARLRALRRPTLGAWLGNLLVHNHPVDVRALLALGASLREAQAGLDGEQVRELTVRRRAVVAALVRQARAEAVQAGLGVGQAALDELEQTLMTVLADGRAAAAFATGRLAKPLRPGSLPDELPAAPAGPARTVAADRPDPTRRGRVAAAREDVRAARREAAAAGSAADAARRELERAAARRRTAEEKVRDLAGRLEQARFVERTAAGAERALLGQVESTDRVHRKALGRARDAEAHLRHLTDT